MSSERKNAENRTMKMNLAINMYSGSHRLFHMALTAGVLTTGAESLQTNIKRLEPRRNIVESV